MPNPKASLYHYHLYRTFALFNLKPAAARTKSNLPLRPRYVSCLKHLKAPVRSQSALRPPNSVTQPESEKTGDNERPGENPSLSSRQRSALPAIVASPTMRQAARSSGISESTLYRWLEDETFREELARQREEVANFAYQELRGLTLRIVSVFAESMEDPDPAIRLRAARYAANFTAQIHETQQLRADIQALEYALDEWKTRIPLH